METYTSYSREVVVPAELTDFCPYSRAPALLLAAATGRREGLAHCLLRTVKIDFCMTYKDHKAWALAAKATEYY